MSTQGACYCGQTTFEVDITSPTTGESNVLLSAYCHCSACQILNGSPFVQTFHIKEEAVRYTSVKKPVEFEVPSKPGKFKLRCENCGSPIGTHNKGKNKFSIWPANLTRDAQTLAPFTHPLVAPTDHQFYGEWKAFEVKDDLPKWVGYAHQSERVG